jgi:ribosomal protein L14E/L6E/L27E|nr:MAG TPA: minor structural protein [Caudoviricetes sp.]
MALTRKLLKGMGLTDEQVDTIIEAHTDTVDGLKADVTRYKADAEKLPGVQKQLDDLKAASDGGYKEKYEKEHSAFEAFKTDITAKESKAAKEKAVRAYFESKNITGANLDLAMRGCGEEMAALELDGEKIKDTKALDALVDGTYKGLVAKASVRVDMGGRLNDGGKPMTKDEIMKITDRAERRAAIAANMDLFRKEE